MSADNAVTRRPHPVTAPRRCEASRDELDRIVDRWRAGWLRVSPRSEAEEGQR